jgi:hypothetical protein
VYINGVHLQEITSKKKDMVRFLVICGLVFLAALGYLVAFHPSILPGLAWLGLFVFIILGCASFAVRLSDARGTAESEATAWEQSEDHEAGREGWAKSQRGAASRYAGSEWDFTGAPHIEWDRNGSDEKRG